jgi:hypothetical protein
VLVQTPPFLHGSFQQLSYLKAQPVPQLTGQAYEAAMPVLSSTLSQSMVESALKRFESTFGCMSAQA